MTIKWRLGDTITIKAKSSGLSMVLSGGSLQHLNAVASNGLDIHHCLLLRRTCLHAGSGARLCNT